MTAAAAQPKPSPESLLPVEIYAKYSAAFYMIDALNRKNGPGGREWVMSIPARPDHDPDLVIWDAIRSLRDGLAAAYAREERLVNALLRVGVTLTELRMLSGAVLLPDGEGRVAEMKAAIAESKEARAR